VPASQIAAFVKRHRDRLAAVVVRGGEPCLQEDLSAFLARLRHKGPPLLSLETNGSRPEVLKTILDRRLVDHVAVDIKAPFEKYELAAGVPVPTDDIAESIRLVASSGLAHEFRSTPDPALLTAEDIQRICAMLPAGSPCRIRRPTAPYTSQQTYVPLHLSILEDHS
jgi:pyruvate formate lyase activating enzyme